MRLSVLLRFALALQATVFKKFRSAAVTAAGRSTCTQCPALSIKTLPRKSVIRLSNCSAQPASNCKTMSFAPARKNVGTSIFVSLSCG